MEEATAIVQGQKAVTVQGDLSMIDRAIVNKCDPETLNKLMDLQERYNAMEAKKAFVKAMACFKRDCPAVIGKDRKADFGAGKAKYSYATTGAIVAAITPHLSRHGLSLSWETAQEPNAVRVTCHVTHDQGHRESATLCGPRDESGGKNPIQTIGSSVHYLQRYTMVSVLGLATADMDDPDENPRPPVAMPTPRPKTPPPPVDQPAEPQAPTGEQGPVAEGLVEGLSKKPTKREGAFRYGIKVQGSWFNTFSESFYHEAEKCKEEGRAVRIAYHDGQFGKDIDGLEVMGDAAEPTTETDNAPF